MITVSNVSLTFGGQKLFSGADLKFMPGNCYGVIGANGAGKSTLIKRISGKSVSEWIDNYVILEAKTLLKYSNMSVQEIAYYLNFPNQSFFGKYFRSHTGMTPSAYRMSK